MKFRLALSYILGMKNKALSWAAGTASGPGHDRHYTHTDSDGNTQEEKKNG